MNKWRFFLVAISTSWMFSYSSIGQKYEHALFTEATSVIRGHKSINLTYEWYRERLKYGLGVDYYYGTAHYFKLMQHDKLSYSLNFKTGFDLHRKQTNIIYIGLYQKLSELHIVEYDDEPGTDIFNRKDFIYEKSYRKSTSMIFFDVIMPFRRPFFLGVEAAFGYAFLFDIRSKKSEDYKDLKMFEGGDGLIQIKGDQWIDHGWHENGRRRNDAMAIQLNIMLGVRF